MTSLVLESVIIFCRNEKYLRHRSHSIYHFCFHLGHASNRTTPSPMLFTSSLSSGKRSPSTPPFPFPKHPRTEATPPPASSGNIHFPMNQSPYWTAASSRPLCAIDRSKLIFRIDLIQRWSFIRRERDRNSIRFRCTTGEKEEKIRLSQCSIINGNCDYLFYFDVHSWATDEMFVRALSFFLSFSFVVFSSWKHNRTRLFPSFLNVLRMQPGRTPSRCPSLLFVFFSLFCCYRCCLHSLSFFSLSLYFSVCDYVEYMSCELSESITLVKALRSCLTTRTNFRYMNEENFLTGGHAIVSISLRGKALTVIRAEDSIDSFVFEKGNVSASESVADKRTINIDMSGTSLERRRELLSCRWPISSLRRCSLCTIRQLSPRETHLYLKRMRI